MRTNLLAASRHGVITIARLAELGGFATNHAPAVRSRWTLAAAAARGGVARCHGADAKTTRGSARRPFRSPFVAVERTGRVPEPIFQDGVPLAQLIRAVLDACRRLAEPGQVRALLTEAVQRHRVEPARLLSELDAGNRRGSAVPREAGLAWEIDSYEFHFRCVDYARTVDRNARYAAAGVLVLQTLPSKLRKEPESVAAELIAAHRAAESRPPPDVRGCP